MASVSLRLFGLGKTDSDKVEAARRVEPGTTIQVLWESLRREAAPGDRLATLEREGLLALLNGRPLRTKAEWESPVLDGDSVVYMPKAFGG